MKDRNKEVRIEVVGRRRRRRKQLLDYLKKTRDYCKLKEEALDRDLWRIRFGRGNGRLKADCTKRMNAFITTGYTFVY